MLDLASLFSIQSLVKVWDSFPYYINAVFVASCWRSKRCKESSWEMIQMYEAFQSGSRLMAV